VRGIRLSGKDRVISLSILHHMDAETAEREAYLRAAGALRRGGDEEPGEGAPEVAEPPARFEELKATRNSS